MATLLRRSAKVLGVLAIIGLIFAVIATTFAVWTVRRSYPQVSGTLVLPGLSAPVTVVRDERGVPQIYADTDTDLMMAQGFVHAQDRFWEMDVRRHITSGRLSEMFGATQVETDEFLRTVGWRRVAEQELSLLTDRTRSNLDAYARGVNAYLADRSPVELSAEYAVLGLQNSSYRPEQWTPADSVAWLKALAWDLRGNMDEEISRVVQAASVGKDRAEQLSPPYPFARNRPIVGSGAVVDGKFDQAATPSNAALLPAITTPESREALAAAAQAAGRLDGLLGPHGEGLGSNSWVVAGKLTDTGKPLLANDPHLAPQMPSLWYQAGLHCRKLTDSCRYDVAGWTMSGLPGVFIGHNGRVAWGFTNLGPDVTDLVLEKVSGQTYEYDGQQVPLESRVETIKVAGGQDVSVTVRTTRHGPLISDRGGRFAVAGTSPPDGGGPYAVALRWTALKPGRVMDAIDSINTASDWPSFREAARLLTVPAQNLIYADVDGNIGYQSPGDIPKRIGYDGRWPVAGWSSKYDWDGYIPFEALPSVYNPTQGYIATANQAVIGPSYPYLLTNDWSYGSRSEQINQRILSATANGSKMTAATMAQIQMDNRSDFAAFVAPKIGSLATDANRKALALFSGWDFEMDADSAAAAYFAAFYRELLQRTINSKITSDAGYLGGEDRAWETFRTLWDSPNDPWWTDGTNSANTTRDQTVTAALDAAAAELSRDQGSNETRWRWGAMHTLTITNQTLGTSGIAPIEWLFNRGPYELSGGSSVVNATGWEPHEGYGVDWVPSMRQVIDLSNLDNSTWVNLTGASGHAFHPNYRDQTDAWVAGDQFPWKFTPGAVDAAARNRLTLNPS